MPDLTSLDRSHSQSFVRQQTRRLDPQFYVGREGDGRKDAPKTGDTGDGERGTRTPISLI